ncbi:hypothetical protein ABVV53_00690 [Novosphingobium sp. RD2P27]|uniref:Uncharacterized protein n=1 Tax=Novosphingobium kalidii TaxID=3230299 RepID=A0ABV2CWK5_9SPHN
MAFIDFKDGTLQAAVPVLALGRSQVLAPLAEPLTQLERRVIELAREDSLASLRPQRKRSWLARLVFGPQPPSPVLANDRLEALRRLAVQAWHHGYQLPASALKAASEAGYSETQIGAVIDTIARLRKPLRRLPA